MQPPETGGSRWAIDAAPRGYYTARMAPRGALLAALLALSFGACSGVPSSPGLEVVQPSATAQPRTVVLVTPTPGPGQAATSTLRPTVPARQPTVSNAPVGPCPPGPSDIPVPQLGDPLEAGEAIVEYLNAGGAVEALRELATPPSVVTTLGTSGDFSQPDLNGDGIAEIAISLLDMTDVNLQGRVYIAMCESGRYRLAYATDFSYTDAHIGPAFDLTGDQVDELLIVRENCGAHTCFEWVEVVSWHRDQLMDLMQDVSFDLPSTGIQLFGPLMDGSYQIYMTGNGVASVGAGPYQKRAVTWSWSPDAHRFQPVDVRLLPSDHRIHFVHDGDRSFALGNYSLALEYYNRVIQDDHLKDWPSEEFASQERRYGRLELAAYVRFRRVLTRLKMDDFASAEAHYQDLLDNHPPGEPGEGFAGMGQAFWEVFSVSRDFDAACAAAQEYAGANRREVLEHLEYGYSNPTYTPQGLCPTAP